MPCTVHVRASTTMSGNTTAPAAWCTHLRSACTLVRSRAGSTTTHQSSYSDAALRAGHPRRWLRTALQQKAVRVAQHRCRSSGAQAPPLDFRAGMHCMTSLAAAGMSLTACYTRWNWPYFTHHRMAGTACACSWLLALLRGLRETNVKDKRVRRFSVRTTRCGPYPVDDE